MYRIKKGREEKRGEGEEGKRKKWKGKKGKEKERKRIGGGKGRKGEGEKGKEREKSMNIKYVSKNIYICNTNEYENGYW